MLMKRAKRILIRYCLIPLLLLLVAGYMVPEAYVLPVAGMNKQSFNHASYWYYPWGASICHKGVDIFAPKGQDVYSGTAGIVLSTQTHPRGGKMVLVLGPKWRIHHYLHLDTVLVHSGEILAKGTRVGKVGNTGNAAKRPPHLHYSITTPLPYFWQADAGRQGWKKMWYLDPTPYMLRQPS
jgi:murein DD-endopeptidase MepM/ murein hydrolase activator NlpD